MCRRMGLPRHRREHIGSIGSSQGLLQPGRMPAQSRPGRTAPSRYPGSQRHACNTALDACHEVDPMRRSVRSSPSRAIPTRRKTTAPEPAAGIWRQPAAPRSVTSRQHTAMHLLRKAGQGFLPGLVVGAVWALWTVRQRRASGGAPPFSPVSGWDGDGDRDQGLLDVPGAGGSPLPRARGLGMDPDAGARPRMCLGRVG
jgi:hypothetical protein